MASSKDLDRLEDARRFGIPARAPWTPAAVGQYYCSPLTFAQRTTVPTLNRLILNAPFFSGADGVTLDTLDVNVNTVGTATCVCRMGVYVLTDQSHPFRWVSGSRWADLFLDAGTVATDGSTGRKTITPASPIVIPAFTWFAVGSADQVATAATRNVGGSAGALWYSPLGNSSAGGYNSSPGIALAMDGVTGALPVAFVPTSLLSLDSGVGIHRSA